MNRRSLFVGLLIGLACVSASYAGSGDCPKVKCTPNNPSSGSYTTPCKNGKKTTVTWTGGATCTMTNCDGSSSTFQAYQTYSEIASSC